LYGQVIHTQEKPNLSKGRGGKRRILPHLPLLDGRTTEGQILSVCLAINFSWRVHQKGSGFAMDILCSMRRQIKSLLVMSLMLLSLSSVWSISSWASGPKGEDQVDSSNAVSSELLDEMTFIGEVCPKGQPADVKDTVVFKDGSFVSKKCAEMCKYPASPYFIRHVGNAIEFISETRCTDKDAKIVWRGTVDGEKIKGVFHWTSNRWYWTVEKEFWFEGTLVENNASAIGSQ
jgi:hypothetical protein